MTQKVPKNLLKEKSSFDLLFKQRDEWPEIYFNFHTYYIYFDDNSFPRPVPVDESKTVSFTDTTAFKLDIPLPFNFGDYTFMESEEHPQIKTPSDLFLRGVSEVLWFVFTERLLQKTSFARYPRVRDSLNYHYQWYQEKNGNPKNWLRYFEQTFANDFRIKQVREILESGEEVSNASRFFLAIIEEIEEWLNEKKLEVSQKSNEEGKHCANVEKIKFHGNGAAFAFICKQLVDMRLIDVPKKRNRNDDGKKLLKTLLQHFEVINPKTGEEYSLDSLENVYNDPESIMSRENIGAYSLKDPNKH